MDNDSDLYMDLPKLCAGNDFTVFKLVNDLVSGNEFGSTEIESITVGKRSFSGQLYLRDSRALRTGRALACSCFNNKYVSITLRTDDEAQTKNNGAIESSKSSEWQMSSFENTRFRTGYDLIFQQLLKRKDRGAPQGIIIVAGGTGSGKSTVVRGLIDLYLQQLVSQQPSRRPHFVTYEDPIEALMFETPLEALNSGIDYTPREKGKDVIQLEDALTDALRQTPSLFYIGEVRDDREWEPIVNFAGTGHLVIATTHAGSVTECMKKIFHALQVRTAADRNHIAEKIVGIVHLSPCFLPEFSDVILTEADRALIKKWVLPSLWRSTSHGVSSIVSDGLASILPYNPIESHYQYSSIGRRWFAREMLKSDQKYHRFKTMLPDPVIGLTMYDKICSALDRKAAEMDLKGM